jgi:hypothetical protein
VWRVNSVICIILEDLTQQHKQFVELYVSVVALGGVRHALQQAKSDEL